MLCHLEVPASGGNLLSTLESEYNALSTSMRALLPLRALLVEVVGSLLLPNHIRASVSSQVFEDNNGAVLLAKQCPAPFQSHQILSGQVTCLLVLCQDCIRRPFSLTIFLDVKCYQFFIS
jgi:hypothetical protein